MLDFAERTEPRRKTLAVSTSAPGYSETWLLRMNDLLAPDVEAIYFQGVPSPNAYKSPVRSRILTPEWTSRLPTRITRTIQRRRIFSGVRDAIAESPDANLLIHYVTTGVYLHTLLDECDAAAFVHCHGHDVTWNRRVEKLPFLPAHPRGYVDRVRRLSERAILIANSLNVVDRLTSIGVPSDRIRLKYLGVDVPRCPPRVVPVENGEVVLLYLGRLTDCKGPVETILAFDLACRRGLRGRLLIAGGGAQTKRCTKAIRSSQHGDRISLLGPVPPNEARRLLHAAHLFTAHNRQSPITGQEEAYGASIVEAMAAGLPVITGRNGGVCETVVDGETGRLFTPGSIEEHADALLMFASDESLRLRCGQEGHRRALAHFSLATEKETLIQILNEGRTLAAASRNHPL
jgi:glycosyltransferase involved in cell wall biosynthesis